MGMMRYKLYITILCLSSSLISQEYRDIPDVVTKVGTAAANWLKIESGVRAIGMGGAHVAAGKGVSSIPYNPASVGFVDGTEFYVSKTRYLVGVSHNVLGFGKQMTATDYMGLHLFYLDSGYMDETTPTEPDGTGRQFKVLSMAFSGVYGKTVTDRLKIGGSLKYIREDIMDVYMQSLAIDLGSNFDTGIYGLILGMSVSNFGPEVQFKGQGLSQSVDSDISPDESLHKITEKFPIPLTFRLGLKKEVELPGMDHRVMASIDMINPIDFTVYSSVGLEYNWTNTAFVRMGTHIGHSTAGFSLGLGVKYRFYVLDVAYVNYGVLNNTLQFSLGYQF
tara:strand:- start:254 stop:1258 length:1005 start_codon:yes stop_codon:yes gene_type:complete